jgi:hypothetical protein
MKDTPLTEKELVRTPHFSKEEEEERMLKKQEHSVFLQELIARVDELNKKKNEELMDSWLDARDCYSVSHDDISDAYDGDFDNYMGQNAG